MKVSELLDILDHAEEDADVIIFNNSSEWYGKEDLPRKAVDIINGDVVINFDLEWDYDDLKEYIKG